MDQRGIETATRAARAAGAVLRARWRSAERTVETKLGDPHNLVSDVDREAQAAAVRVIANVWAPCWIVGEEALVEVRANGALCDHGPLGHDEALAWARPDLARYWLIDGLDGTANFLRGLRPFCAGVAYVEDGHPVLAAVCDPLSDETFSVGPGQPPTLNGTPVQVSGATVLEGATVATETMRPFWAGPPGRWPRTLGVRGFGSPIASLTWVACGRLDAYLYLPAPGPQRVGPWDLATGGLLVERAGGVVTGHDGRPFDLWQRGVLAAATPELHAALLERVGGRR